jgi:S1-C subfamily serine protease
MKKLILLLFIPLFSFGQDYDIDYSSERSVIDYFDLNPPKDLLEGVWSDDSRNLIIKKVDNIYYMIISVGSGLDIANSKKSSSSHFSSVGDTIGTITTSLKGDKIFIKTRKYIRVKKSEAPPSGAVFLNKWSRKENTYWIWHENPSEDFPSLKAPANITVSGNGWFIINGTELTIFDPSHWAAIATKSRGVTYPEWEMKNENYLSLSWWVGKRFPYLKTYPEPNFPKENFDKESKMIKTGEWVGNGSGIIISKSGYIVTNHHVIRGANEIEVEFVLEGEVKKFNAEIVQSDKVNDLAIIKIVDMNFDGLDNLTYNFKTRSSDVGTKVYAYGYPMALSSMGKEIKVTDGMINSKTGARGNITTYQITAPIQPGNSGGPLFDDKANFIGINSSGLSKEIVDNVGYTIKSNYVFNLIDVLPKSIDLPSSVKLQSLPLTEQIKEISKYVVLIKVK